MNKTVLDIDPNIWRQNIRYLEEAQYETIPEIDEHESITPTTNKGHLSLESKKSFFGEVISKLDVLREQNEKTEDFFTQVKGNFQNKEDLGKFLNSQEEALTNLSADNIFVKKYQYKTSETSKVLRFGINIQHKELLKELDIYNNQLTKKVTNALQSKLEKQSDISNISGATKYAPFREKYISLTSTEELVVKNAVKYLDSSSNKIALVDIFPREFNNKNTGVGTINIKNLDTHTALLYKTSGNQILVIDPNNPMFSSHLSKYQDDYYTLQTLCTTDPSFKIYSRPEKSETGFSTDKYRDCIDIAVKIAFVLNNSGNSYENFDEIMNSQVIKLVTNNAIIDGVVLSDNFPTRVKQISNFDKIIECNINLKLYNEILRGKQKVAQQIKEESIKKVEEDYLCSLSIYEKEHETNLLGLEENYQKYCEDVI